eukprot:1178929-Prorocentrum_minimum.AAC.3
MPLTPSRLTVHGVRTWCRATGVLRAAGPSAAAGGGPGGRAGHVQGRGRDRDLLASAAGPWRHLQEHVKCHEVEEREGE